MAECPITLEIPTVPVIAPDGFVYERSALIRWNATGRGTSPSTGAPMSATFVPAPEWYVRMCRSKAAEPPVDPAYSAVRLNMLRRAAEEVVLTHGLQWSQTMYPWEARMESAARVFVMCLRVACPNESCCDTLASILQSSSEDRTRGWAHFGLAARVVVECTAAHLPIKWSQFTLF